MAFVQRVVVAGMNGKIVGKVEYDDVTLEIRRCLLTNNLKRNEMPTFTLRDLVTSAVVATVQIRKQGNVINIPNNIFMIPATDPELNGQPSLPYQIGLEIPFGEDP